MVGKRSGNSGKIWAYILAWCKLELNAREVYKKICEVYGIMKCHIQLLLDGFENSSVVRSPLMIHRDLGENILE